MSKPRILVFAYHDMGYECLDLLISRGENIIAVITHEDNPSEQIWFRSVSDIAKSNSIPVYTPESVNTPEWVNRIRAWNPELIFSFYYRNMIKEEILNVPRLGAFNMHGSLLPKYRGRVPINWAVLHGEKESGVTLHYMVKRADAGDIVDQEAVPIGPEDTAQDVFRKAVKAARLVLERRIDDLANGTAPRRRQDESQATYFGGRKPENGRIDWTHSADRIYNLIRAVTHPYPGAFTLASGNKLFIWQARPVKDIKGRPGQVVSVNPLRVATGNGSLEIVSLQWEGKREEPSTGVHGLEVGKILGN
ncbi:MAG TPA: formyltransferase [Nitrospirota bacterium]|nr:formyltransferase [Nitrospirota bacterium]